MSTDWVEFWGRAVTLPPGDARFAPILRAALAKVRPEALRPVAERGLALFHAGRREAFGAVPIAWYGAVCAEHGVALAERFHPALVARATRLEMCGWAREAGRAMRGLSEPSWAKVQAQPYPPVIVIGHAGGRDRGQFLLDFVAEWPRGAYTHLRKEATRAGRKREFERHWGYSAGELHARFTEAIGALGAEGVSAIEALLDKGTHHDALLFESLGHIGSTRAVPIIAAALGASKSARRKAARAGLEALAPDMRQLAIDRAWVAAKGAARRELHELNATPVSSSDSAVQRLIETHGAAWHERGISEETLAIVGRWWVAHLSSDNWYAQRPAYAEVLAAHRELPGAAVLASDVLLDIERSGARTLSVLREAFGQAAVDARVRELLASAKLPKSTSEDLLRVFCNGGELGAEAALGAAASTTATGKEHALAIILRAAEPADSVRGALASKSADVRELAARVVEVRGLSECFAALESANARERSKAPRLAQARAIATLSLGQNPNPQALDAALAALPTTARRYVPSPADLPELRWFDGSVVSKKASAGLLEALVHESPIAPSPLAQAAGSALDPDAANDWGAALFVEKPTMTKKAHAYRARACVILLSEEALTAWAKRFRRRTSSAFHAELGSLLQRRGTGFALEASTWFGREPQH